MNELSLARRRPERLPPELVEILLASLKELAAAGRAESACRLAGLACAASREESPAAWKAFNVFLHRVAGRTPDP